MLMMQGRGILHCRGIRKYSSNPLETLMNTHCCPKTSMLILSRAMKVNLEAAASVSVSETTATMQTKREASPTAEASEPKRKSTAPRERSQGKDAKHGKGEFKKRDKEPQRMPRELKEGEEKQVRLPKKKTAVLIGYCGTGYSGMQLQTEAKTIEGELFQALVKSGAISQDNADDAKKVDLQRAARTDAGVHAAGNCISLKMITTQPIPEEFPSLQAYINSFLPDTIRVWGYVRTLSGFQARQGCDSRVYEYLLPSYTLLPPRPGTALAQKLDASSPGWRDGLSVPDAFWQKTEEDNAVYTADWKEMSKSERAEIQEAKTKEAERWRGWRVDDASLNRFKEVIAGYKGTHNFHNYTVGKDFKEKTVKRYMLSLEVREPQVYGDIEWVSVRLHGQSFMLHQIRKMISMAVLITRTNTPISLLEETFSSKDITVPKAPPLGLLLEQPQFAVYNERIKQNPGGSEVEREEIDYELYRTEIDAFKVKHIYERLRQEELATQCYFDWTRQMDQLSGSELDYLNSSGTIPESATQKRVHVPRGQGKAKSANGGTEIDSDDDIDQVALKRGELEG